MRIPTPTRTTPEQYPDSDSGESDYHSAEEASPEFDKAAEDGEMGCDWEISRSSISVSYTPKDETYSSNPLLCMNAATFMACINSARALKQLLSRETLQVRCVTFLGIPLVKISPLADNNDRYSIQIHRDPRNP